MRAVMDAVTTAFRFPGHAAQISRVRARIGEIMNGLPIADDVLLAASELATNAVRHTESGTDGGEFVVAVQEFHDRIVLHVADMGGVLTTHLPPTVRPLASIPTWQTGGRGRALVTACATAVNFGTTPCTDVHDDLGGLCCRAVFATLGGTS